MAGFPITTSLCLLAVVLKQRAVIRAAPVLLSGSHMSTVFTKTGASGQPSTPSAKAQYVTPLWLFQSVFT